MIAPWASLPSPCPRDRVAKPAPWVHQIIRHRTLLASSKLACQNHWTDQIARMSSTFSTNMKLSTKSLTSKTITHMIMVSLFFCSSWNPCLSGFKLFCYVFYLWMITYPLLIDLIDSNHLVCSSQKSTARMHSPQLTAQKMLPVEVYEEEESIDYQQVQSNQILFSI